MQKYITENYRFTISVTKSEGCRNGHETGDRYTCEYGCPMPCGGEGGFCAKSMAKLFPLQEVVRTGGDLRTLGGSEKHKIEFTCPDGSILFLLEAEDLMWIKPLSAEHLSEYADVIRRSFATVAREFGLTRENCPTHTSFLTNEQLEGRIKDGYQAFGCLIEEKIIGFASLSDVGGGIYELNNLAILPEYRHFSYGRSLLDFAKAKVEELGGTKITICIIEENTVLKNWYLSNEFIHRGTKRFEHLPFTVGFMEWSVGKHR